MRYLPVFLVALVVLIGGCAREIGGVAQRDPRGPATAVTDDGFGIIVGDRRAPVQLELYTEPQCTHCADLQRDFGKQLASYLDLGQLVVTYRPLTFLDDRPGGYSDHVANAMFLAAGPKDVGAGVPDLRRGPVGPPGAGHQGPSNDDMAKWAREAVSTAPRSRRSRPVGTAST